MPIDQQSSLHNRLLKALSPFDYGLLAPRLSPVRTSLHEVLLAANQTITALYFPEVGFASVTSGEAGQRIEVGMIGREGLVGASPLMLGGDRSPFDHFVQAPGDMLRIAVPDIADAMTQSASLHDLLQRYVQTLLVQTAQTAFVNATGSIEARLARWLLMCEDRLGTHIAITHEFLAMMLGVQRTSVTLAVQTIEGMRLIRARRGRIEILDRPALIALSQGYGLPEAEYERLIEHVVTPVSLPRWA